jgi:hypothetical protein
MMKGTFKDDIRRAKVRRIGECASPAGDDGEGQVAVGWGACGV